MWKIIRLFFKITALLKQFPVIIQEKILEICIRERLPMNMLLFRRRSINYFSLEITCDDFSIPEISHRTYWGFYIDSLEMD